MFKKTIWETQEMWKQLGFVQSAIRNRLPFFLLCIDWVFCSSLSQAREFRSFYLLPLKAYDFSLVFS